METQDKPPKKTCCQCRHFEAHSKKALAVMSEYERISKRDGACHVPLPPGLNRLRLPSWVAWDNYVYDCEAESCEVYEEPDTED